MTNYTNNKIIKKMNWNKINTKYPNALNAFCNWNVRGIFYEDMSIVYMDNEVVQPFEEYRDLYDFFDEHDIYISVIVSHTYGYSIVDKYCNNYELYELAETRAEIETMAFEKAFEILEELI